MSTAVCAIRATRWGGPGCGKPRLAGRVSVYSEWKGWEGGREAARRLFSAQGADPLAPHPGRCPTPFSLHRIPHDRAPEAYITLPQFDRSFMLSTSGFSNPSPPCPAPCSALPGPLPGRRCTAEATAPCNWLVTPSRRAVVPCLVPRSDRSSAPTPPLPVHMRMCITSTGPLADHLCAGGQSGGDERADGGDPEGARGEGVCINMRVCIDMRVLCITL